MIRSTVACALSHDPFIHGPEAAVILMDMSMAEAKSIKSSFKNSPPLSEKNPFDG